MDLPYKSYLNCFHSLISSAFCLVLSLTKAEGKVETGEQDALRMERGERGFLFLVVSSLHCVPSLRIFTKILRVGDVNTCVPITFK